MINQQDYLQQNKEEILKLVKKSFSNVLVYQKLKLEKFGISQNALDYFLSKQEECDRQKVVKAQYSSNKKLQPNQKINNWKLIKKLGYRRKDDVAQYEDTRTTDTGSSLYWECECQICGNTKPVNIAYVTTGRSKSCCGNRKTKREKKK